MSVWEKERLREEAERAWGALQAPAATAGHLWSVLSWAAILPEERAWAAAERMMRALNVWPGGDSEFHGEIFALQIIAATPKLAGAGLEARWMEESDDEGGVSERRRCEPLWPDRWEEEDLLGPKEKETLALALRSLAEGWSWADRDPGWGIEENLERSKEWFCSGLSESVRQKSAAALAPLVEAELLKAASAAPAPRRAGLSL